MFIGRKWELEKLETYWTDEEVIERCDHNPIVVLHGRRKIGKTSLLRKFAEGKDCLFLTAEDKSLEENMRTFNNLVVENGFGDDLPREMDCHDFFRNILKLAKKRKFLLVIDELSFLCKADDGFMSFFRANIEAYRRIGINLMIVFCGSSLSFMTEEFRYYDRPFYGMAHTTINLQPMRFTELAREMPDFPIHDLCVLYGITGGVPRILDGMDPRLPLEMNLTNTFMKSPSVFDTPEFFLRQDTEDAERYERVLHAVATGKHTRSKIINAVKFGTEMTDKMIWRLCHMGILAEDNPFRFSQDKEIPGHGKRFYRVNDPYMIFWYKHLKEYLQNFEEKRTENVGSQIIKDISGHMGFVFEDICRQLMLACDYPGPLFPVARWWGKIDGRDIEIDAVGRGAAREGEKERIAFAECKWESRPTGKEILESLVEKVELAFPREKWRPEGTDFVVFSKAPFTDGCRELASEMTNNDTQVFLVELDEMKEIMREGERKQQEKRQAREAMTRALRMS